MTVAAFGDEATAPTEMIIMWDDALSNIPSGWALCDGNNGTPNLLDRMPKQVSGSESVGDTGGQNNISLSQSQIPSHDHDGPTDSSGGHSHNYSSEYNAVVGSSGTDFSGTNGGGGSDAMDTESAHTHSVSEVDTGSGASIDNRPSYYEVAYIMKL